MPEPTPQIEELRRHIMALAALTLAAERSLQTGDVEEAKAFLNEGREASDFGRTAQGTASTHDMFTHAIASLNQAKPHIPVENNWR